MEADDQYCGELHSLRLDHTLAVHIARTMVQPYAADRIAHSVGLAVVDPAVGVRVMT